MPDEATIRAAQERRLLKFLEIYGKLHEAGMSKEDVLKRMKEVGAPNMNIMNSTKFLGYLELLIPSSSNGESLFD